MLSISRVRPTFTAPARSRSRSKSPARRTSPDRRARDSRLDAGSLFDHSPHQRFDGLDVVESCRDRLFARAQRAMQRRRDRALLGREIAVARRHAPSRRARGPSRRRRAATGTSRSRTIRSITAHCCASFRPKTARSGCTMLNSFSTTVATPSKCPGRRSPSSGFATAPTLTVVCAPGGYITSTGGRNRRSTLCLSSSARRALHRADSARNLRSVRTASD